MISRISFRFRREDLVPSFESVPYLYILKKMTTPPHSYLCDAVSATIPVTWHRWEERDSGSHRLIKQHTHTHIVFHEAGEYLGVVSNDILLVRLWIVSKVMMMHRGLPHLPYTIFHPLPSSPASGCRTNHSPMVILVPSLTMMMIPFPVLTMCFHRNSILHMYPLCPHTHINHLREEAFDSQAPILTYREVTWRCSIMSCNVRKGKGRGCLLCPTRPLMGSGCGPSWWYETCVERSPSGWTGAMCILGTILGTVQFSHRRKSYGFSEGTLLIVCLLYQPRPRVCCRRGHNSSSLSVCLSARLPPYRRLSPLPISHSLRFH